MSLQRDNLKLIHQSHFCKLKKKTQQNKQEAHGPHLLLRNQFKWAMLWLYIYMYYKTDPVVQEEKIFKFHKIRYFCILILSPNVKRCGLSIWTNSNPLYPKMLFTKFAWDWPNGSIEDFKILSVEFYYFVSSPLGKWGGPSFE